MRKTHALVQVALALLDEDFDRHQWGYDLGKRAGVRSGVLYPILQRLLEAGWLHDGWETEAEARGRPRRRYYDLTGEGRRELGALVAEAATEPRFAPVFAWQGSVR
jgi:PadR family transcriptional regulator PadR